MCTKKINYLTPETDLNEIFKKMNLDPNRVTNVYNHGSRVHGYATETSDYDILIVANVKQKKLKFKKNFKEVYFHTFDLNTYQINDKQYDVVMYSSKNFKKIIKRNFLNVIECFFNMPEFIPVNKIDYKKIYLEKYYDKNLIGLAIISELEYSLYCVDRYKINI